MKFRTCSILALSLSLLLTTVGVAEDKLTIGWQTTWATQGQLALILQKTDIFKKHDINAEFKGFSFGGPVNEAALAGEVNAIFTADQPALTLLSKSNDWVIAGRLMYNSAAVIAHPDSDVKTMADFKNKKVGVPFVAAAHRVLVDLEKRAGIVPGKTVTNLNIGLNELIALVQGGKEKGWGDLAGLAVWDPLPLLFESKGLAKTIDRENIIALYLIKRSSIGSGTIDKFRASLADAYRYYRTNRAEVNGWYKEMAKIDYDAAILDKAASVEPNLSSETITPRLTLNESDIANLKITERFLLDERLISNPVDIDAAIAR